MNSQEAIKKFRGLVALDKFRSLMKSGTGERWITLENGTHVMVDGDGNITKGPAELKEKGITNLSHFGKDGEKTSKKQNSSTTVDKPKEIADTPVSEATTTPGEKKMNTKQAEKVGDKLAAMEGRMSEIEPNTIRVQHAKGYSGRLSNKSYVAKIEGLDDKYGMIRDFQNADEVDYGDSQLFKKNKGVFHNIHKTDKEGGIYEKNEHGEREYQVHFPIIKEGKAKLGKKTTNEEDIKKSLKTLKNSGMDASDLVKAMTDSQGMEGTVHDRVLRWTRAAMDKDVAEDFESDDEARAALNGEFENSKIKELPGYKAAVKRRLGITEKT